MQNVYFANGKTLSEQYYKVGKLNSVYITDAAKKNARKRSKLKIKRRHLLSIIQKRLSDEKIFNEFYSCLTAWCAGAGITVKSAVELLDDNTGCQTVMARFKNGIALIHTEEELDDIKARMTPPQIMAFNINGNNKYTLVYNNLIPGAGVFGWGADYAIAIDSLFLSEDGVYEIKKPMLANVASWLLWRKNVQDLSLKQTVKLIWQAGNYVDGYAINVVRRINSLKEGYKIIFTRDKVESEILSDATGSSLYQLNIIDSIYQERGKAIAKWQLPYRRFYRGYWNYYKERKRIIKDDIAMFLPYTKSLVKNHRKAHDIILKEIFGPLASHYINEVTGAVSSVLVGKNEMSVAVGLVENSRLKRTEYFQTLSPRSW